MAFNAFMPGEDNWMRGQPMPGQGGMAAPAQPEKKRNPVMNAFSKVFEYGAPEAFQQGRDRRLTQDLGNALAEGNYGGAAEMALRGGKLDQGLQLRDMAETRQKGQIDEQRKAQAQGTYQLFSTMQALQINDYAMQDPVGFERATGMSSQEYLQAAQQFQQYGMTPEKFREYVLQKAQAELGMESKAPEPYTLAPGAQRYGADGKLVAENPRAEKPLEQWEDYTPPGGMPGLFQRNATTGEVKRVAAPQSGGIRIGPDGSVQIGGPAALDGVGYGSAPKGQEAAIAFDRDGNPIVTPGPQQEQYNKAIRGLGEFQAQNAIVIEDIDRALNSISGWSTGAGAALKDLPIVGGITPAGQMESLLSTIQSNVGFDKLQAMREASPTGGALGSVTEKELAFLQSVFGSLRQDTSPENVRYNLERLKGHMQGREQRLQQAIAADFPSLATTAQRRGAANVQVQELNDLLEFMTPEERALFEGGQ